MSKENKEWFKVIEIADMLGFSKVTIYNKIKEIKEETLQPLRKKEKGITYYNYKLIDILRNENLSDDSFVDIKSEEMVQDEMTATVINDKYIDLYISELKSEIEFLKNQILIKDELIIKQLKLIENEQILRREDQKGISLLEEQRIKNIDEKMTTWREVHFKEESKEGFFKRIFKRKGENS